MIQIRPLDYLLLPDGEAKPADLWLWDKATEYCKKELAAPIDFRKLAKVWVALDEDNEIAGISGYCIKADIPIFRVTGQKAIPATKRLYDRMNSFFADQGMTGQEVFLHISSKETPEQRCPAWQESLSSVNAVLADRYSLTVK